MTSFTKVVGHCFPTSPAMKNLLRKQKVVSNKNKTCSYQRSLAIKKTHRAIGTVEAAKCYHFGTERN